MPDRSGGSGENHAMRMGWILSTADRRLPTVLCVSIRDWLGKSFTSLLNVYAGLAFHPPHDRARRRVRADLGRAVQRARTEQTFAGKVGAVRMRHAGGGRRARTTVGEVLPGRDDLPA